MTTKPRVIKSYEKLDEAVLEQIKLAYPAGFAKHLIRFTDANGRLTSALPFETDDRYYLVRMTKAEAADIIADDDDYDDEGNLLDDVRDEYEDKYGDEDDDYDEVGDDDIDPDDLADEENDTDEDEAF